jgi:hypothetical protein
LKKQLLSLIVVALCFALNLNEVRANVYASGIRISDDSVSDYNAAGSSWDGDFTDGGVKIWFVINEPGSGSLTSQVVIKQGVSVIRTLNVPSPVQGVNNVVWDGYDDLAAAAPTGNYSFEVTVSDPTGHSVFDSIWVAGAYYQGNDFDGGTSFAYRGNASISDQSSENFGNLYVARGTSSINGFYEITPQGAYVQKIGLGTGWPNSTPNELTTVGNSVYGLAGYGFTGGGFIKGFDATTDAQVDSAAWGTLNMRGLIARVVGNDTIFYSGRSGSGVNAIVSMINGDTATYIDMGPYITGNGYIKSLAFDDLGRLYVAYGEASASRKKLAFFDTDGSLLAADSLDGSFGLAADAILQAIAIDGGSDPNDASDDKIYALIRSGTSSQSGIYEICAQLCSLTQLISPVGVTTAATSQIINVDPAGNVIWSNGAASERIIAFSPAGPNSFTTSNPAGYDINVTNAVPVELTSFAAVVNQQNKVQLNWTTATETNNQGFDVERNINGTWDKIAFVSGYGTTTERKSYTFIDEELSAKGKISYRLKQIDFDGTISYSQVVEVNLAVPEQFQLSQNYPNPFNPTTTISFKIPVDAQVKLEIFSLSGELVEVLANEYRNAGEYNIEFNASALASGTYIYRLSAGTTVISKKMLLMK